MSTIDGTSPSEIHIPARTGTAFRVDAGAEIEIVDLQGQQPADFWAYYENDLGEYLSAPHTRIANMRLMPGVNGTLLADHAACHAVHVAGEPFTKTLRV